MRPVAPALALALVVVAACARAPAPAVPSEHRALTRTGRVTDIISRGEDVIWAQQDSRWGLPNKDGAYTIRSMSTVDGGVQVLATSATVVKHLAADRDSVYFVTAELDIDKRDVAALVWSVPRRGGRVTQLARVKPRTTSFVAYDGYVYIASTYRVLRVAPGPLVELAPLAPMGEALAIDAVGVASVDDGRVFEIPHGATDERHIGARVRHLRDPQLTPTHVIGTTYMENDPWLVKVSRRDGTVEVFLWHGERAEGLTLAAGRAYWWNPEGDAIVSVEVDAPKDVRVELARPYSPEFTVTDSGKLVWAEDRALWMRRDGR